MNSNYDLTDLFPQPDDVIRPSREPQRTKNSPIEQYYLQCEYCSVHTEWESDIWSWTAGVRELRALGWRTKNKLWVCPACSPIYCRHGNGDLWRCGICGEITEDDPGLLPVIVPDGSRHLACPDCRQEYPELVVAQDGEMYAEYAAPLVDGDHLPFGLDAWLDPDE